MKMARIEVQYRAGRGRCTGSFVGPGILKHGGEGEGLGDSKQTEMGEACGDSLERRIFEVENHHVQRPEMKAGHGWAGGVWEGERHLGACWGNFICPVKNGFILTTQHFRDFEKRDGMEVAF